MRSMNSFSTVILVLVIATAAYLGGYATALLTTQPVPGGTLFTSIFMASPTPVSGASAGTIGHLGSPREVQDKFKPFWEVWELIGKEYYDRPAIDQQKLIYGAIRGMVETLGDPHTSFVQPERARQINEDMSGSFEGIGTTVEMRENRVTIISPIEDSPAQKAGLRPNDVIVKVNDQSIEGLALADVIKLIRGPRGTEVKLTIERASKSDPAKPEMIEMKIIRDRIKQASVLYKPIPSKDTAEYAHITITGFNGPTSDELRDKLKEVMTTKPKGIILDLRNNPGGYLHTAVEVTSQFLAQKYTLNGKEEESIVLYEKHSDGRREPFKVKPDGQATEVPLVVLINGGSASASEIVAGALQDRGRAVLIGTMTYGKGSVQNVHELSDKSSFRVTVARWLTPDGHEIHGKGLIPDIEVKPAEGRDAEDVQLKRAIEYLQTGK